MRKVSRDSPTQPPYNLGFKHTTMAKISNVIMRDCIIDFRTESIIQEILPTKSGKGLWLIIDHPVGKVYSSDLSPVKGDRILWEQSSTGFNSFLKKA